MAEKKERKSFDEEMRDASQYLVNVPTALEFGVQKTEGGRHYFSFHDTSENAIEARKSIKEILKRLYDNGAYSYGQFADKLRVDITSIQAIMDEEFIEKHNL